VSTRDSIKLFSVAALLCGAWPASSARAHHPDDGERVDDVLSSHAGLDVRSGALAGDSVSDGYFLSFVPSGSWAPLPHLAFGLELPVHHVWLDDGSERFGLGDLGAWGLGRLLHDPGRFELTVGLGVEAPTGAHHEGLGSGHVELGVSTAARFFLEEVTLRGGVGLNHALASHDHAGVGAAQEVLIDDHRDTELLGEAGARWTPGDGWFFCDLAVRTRTVLSVEDRGMTGVTALPKVGLLHDGWLGALHATAPLTTYRPYDFQVGLVVKRLF
jgi:hypothetical protein